MPAAAVAEKLEDAVTERNEHYGLAAWSYREVVDFVLKAAR